MISTTTRRQLRRRWNHLRLNRNLSILILFLLLVLLLPLGLLIWHSYRISGVTVFPALPPLSRSDLVWPTPDSLCSVKIYIVPLPPSLELAASNASHCRWSAYSSELLLHRALLDSPLRTLDPDQATHYFIPLFPACHLFNCWTKDGKWELEERCKVDEYIESVMTHIRSTAAWQKRGGRDHIIVHPMDRADSYYSQSSRSLMNESIYLVTVGDLRPSPWSEWYRRHRDIVIPSATHLLHSYYYHPLDYLDDFGHPLSSPSPQPESSLISTQIFRPSIPRPPSPIPTNSISIFSMSISPSFPYFRFNTLTRLSSLRRPINVIFRGSPQPAPLNETYSLLIRSLFYPTSSPPLPPHPGFSSLLSYSILPTTSNEQYALDLSRSRFGLVPPGYTLDTTRLWEYLAFGVVPVFLGTGPRGGQVMPGQDDVDYEAFSVFVERERVHELERILNEVSEERYERLRKAVWEVGRTLVLTDEIETSAMKKVPGQKSNWEMIALALCRMKSL